MYIEILGILFLFISIFVIRKIFMSKNIQANNDEMPFDEVEEIIDEENIDKYVETAKEAVSDIVKKASSGRLDMIKNLLPDAVIELKEKGKIMFEVEEPKG